MNVFRRFRERELKMIWQVRKGRRCSLLVGTAHFFPHSFRTSLSRLLEDADTVLFEGPLDKDNLEKVVQAGRARDDAHTILDALDQGTLRAIGEALGAPPCSSRRSFLLFRDDLWNPESYALEVVKGKKPWLAFFNLWVGFLERQGWRYSVDMEGYTLAEELGKRVVALETIEEQIRVLESLSREKILHFLRNVEHWEDYIQDYAARYLAGDFLHLRSVTSAFPSRTVVVIDSRDGILFRRMLPYLEEGKTVAFLGAPHIRGIRTMLESEGYDVSGPPTR